MYNRKYMLGIVVLFFIISFVSAIPPQTIVNTGDVGLNIFYPQLDYIKQNEDFTFHIHVSNISNGLSLPNTNISCSMHLYNTVGLHTYEDGLNKDGNLWDHEITIMGGNFSDVGLHSFYIWCNNSQIGGEAKASFSVTESGVEITEGRSILIIGLMGILFLFVFASLFALFSIENYMVKFISYWISHVLMILISFVGWQIGVEGLLVGTALTGIFRIMFWIFLVGMFPMILLSIVWIFYIHAFNEHFQKLIDKGETPETAFAITNKKRGWRYGN